MVLQKHLVKEKVWEQPAFTSDFVPRSETVLD